MTNEKYHPIAIKLLKSLIKKESFHHASITKPIAEISYKDCTFWTIENIQEKLILSANNELSKRTIEELINLNSELNFEKAKIFDELSFKNWKEKSTIQKPFPIHNVLSRISWVCLLAICKENNKEYKSNYAGRNSISKEAFVNLINQIGWQSGMTMDLVYKDNFNYGEKMAISITEIMNKIEK